MRYFLPGLLLGIILNLFFYETNAALEIYPEFYQDLSALHKAVFHADKADDPVKYYLKMDDGIYLLGDAGRILQKNNPGNNLTSFSGNGEFYVKYEKVGTEIEFYSTAGDKFWKLKSHEYPYLSWSGKVIFLLNGDHSNIRIVDKNGNETGKRNIRGKLANVICFSTGSDYSGAGFSDGSYYVLNENGAVIHGGNAPAGNVIKSMSVSENGLFAVLHYGDSEKDFLRIVNISGNNYKDSALREVHPVRAPVHVNGQGYAAIMNTKDITRYRPNGKTEYVIQIPQRRYGSSGIQHSGGFYNASYSMESGGARLIVFADNGNIVFSKEFPAESFLQSSIIRNHLFVRGPEHLYCYSIHR